MYEKILVPLDGSKESECIIDHIAMLTKSCGIPKVVLLMVLEPFAHAAAGTYLGDEAVRAAQQKARRGAEEYLSYVSEPLRTHCAGVETVVLEGRPAEKILEFADKNGVDLIAMSTHGASGPARWAVGSVTDRVAAHATAAVLTVRPSSCRP
jgi:nucleotide-binding universal stress UspA family protein